MLQFATSLASILCNVAPEEKQVRDTERQREGEREGGVIILHYHKLLFPSAAEANLL